LTRTALAWQHPVESLLVIPIRVRLRVDRLSKHPPALTFTAEAWPAFLRRWPRPPARWAVAGRVGLTRQQDLQLAVGGRADGKWSRKVATAKPLLVNVTYCWSHKHAPGWQRLATAAHRGGRWSCPAAVPAPEAACARPSPPACQLRIFVLSVLNIDDRLLHKKATPRCWRSSKAASQSPACWPPPD